jgi:sugar lactone lactonase YvrE
MNLFQSFFKGRGTAGAGVFVILGFALLSALTVACRSGDGNGEDGERGGSLPEGYTVTGQIKSTVIAALSGAEVVLKQDGQTVKTETTSLGGLYTFEGLEAGTYLVEASAARHTAKATAAFTLSDDKSDVDLTLDREWPDPLVGELVAGTKGVENGNTPNTFAWPYGLAFGPEGVLYVTDAGARKIRKVTPGDPTITDVAIGKYIENGEAFADGPLGTATFEDPGFLCSAPNGDLYVSDGLDYRVRKIAGGQVSTVAGTGISGDGVRGDALSTTIDYPSGVTFFNGSLYILADKHRVYRLSGDQIETIAGDGTNVSDGDGGPAINAKVSKPFSMAAGPDGSLYFSEFWTHKVRKIDPAGNISALNIVANGVSTNVVGGMTVDLAGTLYLADGGNHRILMVRDGNVRVLLSGDGSGGGDVYRPYGITFGPDGYLYVADSDNRRIMRY